MDHGKLILGTWGLSQAGWHKDKISKLDFTNLLDFALDQGIRNLDMAYVYTGISELINRYNKKDRFYITSKVPAIRKFELDTLEGVDSFYPNFTKIVENILDDLGIKSIDCILLHNWARNFNLVGTRLEQEIYNLKKADKIKFFGISLPDGFNQTEFANSEVIDRVMLPLNYLTEAWAIPIIENSSSNIQYLIRSIFIQGLITHGRDIRKYEADHYLYHRNDIRVLRKLIDEHNAVYGSTDTMRTVISHYSNILGKDNIKIVFGCSSIDQMKDDVKLFDSLIINKK